MKFKPVQIALVPFSLLYGAVTGLRNVLFNIKVLPQKRFSPYLIVVGNIAAGGTGKTPHVIALAEILSNEYKLAVLSRGYKRSSKGFRWVEQDDQSGLSGDEPLEIKTRLPHIAVATDGNRTRGIKRMIQEISPDMILMDDGFQHRYVKADYNLILTRYEKLYSHDLLMPAGRLRESKRAVRRSSAVCVTYSQKEASTSSLRNELKLPDAIPLYRSIAQYRFDADYLPPGDSGILFVSSIAVEAEALQYLKQRFTTVEHLKFKDHHRYTQQDVDEIIRTFKTFTTGKKLLVTTGKDLVKLDEFEQLEDLPVLELRVALDIDSELIKSIEKDVRKYFGKD